MSKKEDKAIAVEAKKRATYVQKVRVLTGHIMDRLDAIELNAGYEGGKMAEALAAEIASREPVGKAIHPLKVEAIDYATQHAAKEIEAIRADLEKHGWDINATAPRARSDMSRDAYRSAANKHRRYSNCTIGVEKSGWSLGEKAHVVKMDDDGCARYTREYQRGAALQYDMFICKLVTKVGPRAASATIDGSHIWGESVLTVTLNDGTTQRWRTHQITNRSKLGLWFPQWPTRLLKGGA